MKTISLIYAVSENHVIGNSNELPVYLPADLKHFKEVTMGHAIIMGSRTFESIGHPLPGRQNIVLTRNLDFEADGVDIASSLEEAIERAEGDEVFVIGGAQVFEQALPLANRIYETRVHANLEGDVFFDPDLGHWLEESQEAHKADTRNPHDYSFIVYVRQ